MCSVGQCARPGMAATRYRRWPAPGATFSEIEPVPPVGTVDATGVGDVFAGTLAAGLSREALSPALVRLACAAASLSLSRAGGAGKLPSLEESKAHLSASTG